MGSSRAEEETPALSWTHPGLSLQSAPQPLTPLPQAGGLRGSWEEPDTQQGSEPSFLPPGVAGVLVGHPFDTVKVSLSPVLFLGSRGGAGIERPVGSGWPEAPFQ